MVLFLASNPDGTSELALGKECSAIQRALRSVVDHTLELHARWAVSVDEMMDCLNDLDPTILHFSGHGVSGSASRGAGGICLQEDCGRQQLVAPRALTMMIKSAATSVRVVVLNACYSDSQADALRKVVDCVIGMTGAIGDDAARSFAAAFYRALAYRRSVGNAMDQALATLAAKRLPDEHLPRCRARDGIDPSALVIG